MNDNQLYDSFEVKMCGPYRFIGKSVYVRAFDKKGSPEVHSSFRKQCGWVFETLDSMAEYESDQPNNAAIQHWEWFNQGQDTMTHWPGQLLFGGTELLGYTVGRFMKAGTPVPDDMDYIDIAEMPVAQGWKKTEPRDDIGMPDEGTMFTAIEKTEDYNPASWLFAADIFPFVSEDGELTRGTFMACIPLSAEDKVKRSAERKAAEESEKAKPALIEALNNLVPRGESVDIDLSAIVSGSGITYANGLLTLAQNADMATPQSFEVPLKMEIRAKLDGYLLFIKYGKGHILIDSGNPNGILYVQDIASGKNHAIEHFGIFPTGEFADIEIVIAAEFTAVKVNGELRYIGNNHDYVNEFAANPEFTLSSQITLKPEAATVTVEKMRVTEL
jgi:hypothetical protein